MSYAPMPKFDRSMSVNFAGLTFLPGSSISNSESALFRGCSPSVAFGDKLADAKVDIAPKLQLWKYLGFG